MQILLLLVVDLRIIRLSFFDHKLTDERFINASRSDGVGLEESS